MNDATRSTPMLTEITTSDPSGSTAEAEANIGMEQQMAALSLSEDTRHFLRTLHTAEKQLNDAFEKAHKGIALQRCVSQVYHDLYCDKDEPKPC